MKFLRYQESHKTVRGHSLQHVFIYFPLHPLNPFAVVISDSPFALPSSCNVSIDHKFLTQIYTCSLLIRPSCQLSLFKTGSVHWLYNKTL